jgi:hypothetical protein
MNKEKPRRTLQRSLGVAELGQFDNERSIKDACETQAQSSRHGAVMKRVYDKSKYRQVDALRARLVAYRAAGGISLIELTTATVLLDFRKVMTGDCFVKHETLAATVGIAIRSVRRYIKRLAEIGLFLILPQRADRNCSTFDFDMDWMPTLIEPALAPVAERVADYDGRFPARAAREVAEALGVSHTSVLRARRSWNIDEIDEYACSKDRGAQIPIEVSENLYFGTEIPPLEHRLEHASGTSTRNSGTMVHHQPTDGTDVSASNRTANLADHSAKKQERTATTVAEQEPLEPHAATQRVCERDSDKSALRAPAPAAAARSRSMDDEGLATKFEQLLDIWQNPNGTKQAKSRTAFLAAVQGKAGGDPDDILAMARRHVETMEPRYFKQLHDWLDDGLWKFPPIDRNRPAAGKKAGGSKKSGKKSSQQEKSSGSGAGAVAGAVAGGMTRDDLVSKLIDELDGKISVFNRYCEKFDIANATEDDLNAAVEVLESYSGDVVQRAVDLEDSLPPPTSLRLDPVRSFVKQLTADADRFGDRLVKAQHRLEDGVDETPGDDDDE